MQSCIYKSYSYLLNKRLDAYLEANDLLNDTQNGFRKGRSCTDHVFSLAETIRLNTGSPKNKVYACFFDMRRAFDEVDRNLLLLRLNAAGVNGSFYKALCAVYKSPVCKVKLDSIERETGWMNSNFGTLQGDVISPKNFSVHINLLLEELQNSGLGIYYGPNQHEKFACLAFADDIVVTASSCADLQKLVDIVNSFCKKWRMSVNTDKTKTMVFRKNPQTKKETVHITYDSQVLEQVDRYKYIGVMFDEVLKFNLAHEELGASGSRALGAIIGKAKTYKDIGYKSYTKLIDTCVNSVTDYCGEFLGHDTPKCIVDVQLRAARFYLGLPRNTSLCCLSSEMGWLPAVDRRYVCVLRYYNRLMRMDLSRMPRRVFESTVNTPGSWAWKTRDLLISLGLDLYWTVGSPIPVELMDFYVKENSKSTWQGMVRSKSKLKLYREFKHTMQASAYVTANIPKYQRSVIAQTMCGCLKLRVETGRFVNEHRSDRECALCSTGETEDEKHFLLSCPAFDCERAELSAKLGVVSVEQLLKRPFVFGKYIYSIWKKRKMLLGSNP